MDLRFLRPADLSLAASSFFAKPDMRVDLKLEIVPGTTDVRLSGTVKDWADENSLQSYLGQRYLFCWGRGDHVVQSFCRGDAK